MAYPRATCRAVAAADLVFANTLEYDLLLRMCDPPREVVVKKGAQGAVYRSSGQSVAATAPIVDVVDPTGAGDAFAGAYLARRLDGASHAAALSDACRVGAAAVESFGADALLRAAPRLRQRLGDGSPDA